MNMPVEVSSPRPRTTVKHLQALIPFLRRRIVAVGIGVALLAGVTARAQTFTWDPGLNHAGSDGGGSWDTSSAIWASGGADVLWPNTATVAIIGSGQGAAGTIVLSPATVITNNGITFNSPLSGNYTLSGGTNYMGGSTPTITVNGSNATILSALQGTGGLTTAGNATLTLGGANTWSGNLTVNSGTLILSSNNSYAGTTAINAGALVITNAVQLTAGVYSPAITDNGTFVYGSTASQLLKGVISGTGGLQVSAGTLTLSNNNTFTGNILVSAGTLVDSQVDNSQNPVATGFGNPQVARLVTVTNGGLINLSSAGGNEFGGGASTPVFTWVVDAGSEVQVTSGNAVMGPVILNGGTLFAHSGNNTTFEALELQSVTVGGSATSLIASSNPTGSGTGANLSINQAAGVLFPFVVAPTGSSSGIDLNVELTLANSGNTAGAAGYVLTGGGTMALTGGNVFTGPVVISNGTVMLANNAAFVEPHTASSVPATAGSLGSGSYAGNITNFGTFIDVSGASQTLSGIISGTGPLIVGVSNGVGVPVGNLTISGGGNNYTGPTIVGGGTLFMSGIGAIATSPSITVSNGGTLDITGITGTTFALGAGQNLYGGTGGFVNGGSTKTLVTSGGVFPGTDGTVGVYTVPSGLTLNFGGTMNFDVSGSAAGANDKVTLTGSLPLTLHSNVLHIKALSPAANLDTSADYVLINTTGSGTIVGAFASAPAFDVAPLNPNNYTVVTTPTAVTLHYSATALPSVNATLSPNPALAGQTALLTVTAVNNGGGTINSITATVGGTTVTSNLVQQSSTVWTNNLFLPFSLSPGGQGIVVVVNDGAGRLTSFVVPFSISTGTFTWNGASVATQNWDDNANWAGGIFPAYNGNDLIFDGTTGLAPVMDQNYSVAGLAFPATAGAFTLTSSGGTSLTLPVNAAVTNNSLNIETVNIPVLLGGPVTLNAAATNLVLAQTVGETGAGAGSLFTLGVGHTNAILGNATYTGATSVGPSNTLVLNGAVDSLSGITIATGGTLVISNTGRLGNGNYTTAMVDNGTFAYNSTSFQTNAAVISGTGGIQVNGPTTFVANAADSFTGNILVNGATYIDAISEGGGGNVTVGGFGNAQTAGKTVTITNGGIVNILGNNSFGFGGSTPNIIFNVGPNSLLETTFPTQGNQMGFFSFNGGTFLICDSAGVQYDAVSMRGITNGGTSPSLITSINNSTSTSGINLGTAAGQVTFNVAPTGNPAGFDLNVNAVMVNANNSQGAAGISLTGGGTLMLTSPNIFSGAITITSGTLMLADFGGTNLAIGTNIPASSGSLGSASLGTGNYTNNITDNGVFNESSAGTPQTLTGIISGSGSVVVGSSNGVSIPTASLTLANAATYSGQTYVGGGTLFLQGSAWIPGSSGITLSNGGILDLTGLTANVLVMGNSENLIGSGVINGPSSTVVTGGASAIIAGSTNNIAGTSTFNCGLTLSSGASVSFQLSTAYNGANSQIVMSSALPLTVNGNGIHIKAPSTSASLDQTADYVLITNTGSGTINGSFFAAPIFDVLPLNANHYSLVTTSKSVVLHYSTTANPTFTSPSTTPSGNLIRNESVLFTITVVPGSNPINDVFLNLSFLGGSTNIPLTVQSGFVYTNTFTIPPSALPGIQTAVAEAHDSLGNLGVGFVSLPIVATTETWVGGGTAGQENLSLNANWVSGLAPGYVGDSLIFASNYSAGLSPNLDTNYTASSVWFSNNAPAFVLSSSDSSSLGLGGGMTNTSGVAQTLNIPVMLTATATLSSTAPGTMTLTHGITNNGYAVTNTGSGTNSIAGITDLGSTGSLTQVGTGMLNLSGISTYAGATVVTSGTLDITGAVESPAANLVVAGTIKSNAVLYIGAGADITNNEMFVGNASNAVGSVFMTGGLVNHIFTAGESLDLGNTFGSFGYFNASGGTLSPNGIAVAGENYPGFASAGSGILDITGGNIINNGWIVMCRGGTASATNVPAGVLNLYSGSLTYAGGGFSCNWAGSPAAENSEINIMGGTLISTTTNSLNLNQNGNANNFGALNLIGGVCAPSYVVGAGQINFNGGTLELAMEQTVASFISASGPNTVLFANGGKINNNGLSLTNASSIVSASGNGISAPTITNAGIGYIAPPIVLITNATGDTTGFGATAIAQINPATGTVTNVVITCPGQNYTRIPVFNFSGGGASTRAGATGNALVANSSGIMTFDGTNGETFLTGPSLYTNTTVITNGGFGLLPGGTLSSGNIYVAANGFFDVQNGFPNGYVWPVNQNVAGTGTIYGAITFSAGDEIIPGAVGGFGSLNFISSVNMGIGSGAVFRLTQYDDADAPGHGAINDQVSVGTLVVNGNSIHIAAPSTSANLDTGDYTLITTRNGVTGALNSVPIWDVMPLNSSLFNIQVSSGSSVILHYSQFARPTGGATANPNPALAGRSVTVTVNATNGTGGNVSQVTVDTTAFGGGINSLSQSSSSGGSSVWSGTFTLPIAVAPGVVDLPVVLTDAQNSIAIPLFLTIGSANFTWNGAHNAVDQNWDDNGNWAGGFFPPYIGNDVTFAGTTGLTPVMDQNYALAGMAFAAGAGSFSLTNSGGDSLTLQAGMTVTNNSSTVQTFNLPVLIGGAVTLNAASGNMVLSQPVGEVVAGTGTIISRGLTNILAGVSTAYNGALAINGGALELADTSLLDDGTYAGNITVNSNSTLIINSTNGQVLSGVISGPGAVQVNGTNAVVTFSGANNYTGPLLVNGATVVDINAEANGAPPGTGLGYSQSSRTITITNGGVVSLSEPGGNFAGYGSVTPAIIFNVGPGCLLVTSNGNDTMGPIILNGGTLLSASTTGVQYDTFELTAITSGGTNGSLITSINPGTPANGVNLTINGAAGAQLTFTVAPTGSGGPDLTINTALVNAGGSQSAAGFILTGGGAMALNQPNVFTGPVTLSNGAVQLNAAETAGTSGPLGVGGAISFGGGVLQYTANNQFDYSSRFATAAGQKYNIDTSNQSITFATALTSGTGALTKYGSGQLNLTTANTYAGVTTISNGSLILSSTGSIANTTGIAISGGGTLDVSSQSTFTVPSGTRLTASGGASHAVITAQALNVNGPITLTYSAGQAALNVNGTLTLNANAFTVNAASPLPAGSYTLIQQQSGNIGGAAGPFTVNGTAIGIGTTASIVVSGSTVQLSVVAAAPASLNFTLNANVTSLSISWPAAFLGSSLLYQSNSASVGLVNTPGSWLVYPGSTTVTNVTIPIPRTNEMFFELSHP